MCMSTILKVNQVWETSEHVTTHIHRLQLVSCLAIFVPNSDVFSSCLKRQEYREVPRAIVLLITRQAQSYSRLGNKAEHLLCVVLLFSFQWKQAEGDL